MGVSRGYSMPTATMSLCPPTSSTLRMTPRRRSSPPCSPLENLKVTVLPMAVLRNPGGQDPCPAERTDREGSPCGRCRSRKELRRALPGRASS